MRLFLHFFASIVGCLVRPGGSPDGKLHLCRCFGPGDLLVLDDMMDVFVEREDEKIMYSRNGVCMERASWGGYERNYAFE
jgi:hypothetical protein